MNLSYRHFSTLIFIFFLSLCASSCTSKKNEIVTVENSTTAVSIQSKIHTFLNSNPDAKYIFLVRHAEKMHDATHNPPLSREGVSRALKLSNELAAFKFSSIYSSNFTRTIKTAEPTAQIQNLKIVKYQPDKLQQLKDKILDEQTNGNVLVVGHSNTTPTLTNLLCGRTCVSNIEEHQYDNLIIVRVTETDQAEMVQLKYGKRTP